MSRRIDRGNRHLKNRTRPLPKPLAVIDTSVFVEILSCRDLRNDVDRLHALHGKAAMDHPDVTFRIARAREAALLAMYLHKIGAHTYSLRGESIGMLARLAPPAPGGTSMDSDFTMVFAHFVNDYVLRGWKNQVAHRPETQTGDDADLVLIEYARRKRIPVITHEGYTPDGIVDDNKRGNMRARCKQAGVDVYAAREFYADKINPTEEIESFLDRFRRKVPKWLVDRGRNDKMGKVLDWVFGYYRMILRGEVEGRDDTVAISLF